MAYPVTDAVMSSSPSMRQLTTLRYMPNVVLLPSKYHGDSAPASTPDADQAVGNRAALSQPEPSRRTAAVYVVATPIVLLRTVTSAS